MIDNYWESKFQFCRYSEQLINKILLLNQQVKYKVNILEIKKAIFYAKKYHGDQKRETGEPYYSHPLAVAYMCLDYRFTTDVIVTSILHDTIEDTELTENMIENIFGSIIASGVENLTRIKKDKKISCLEMIKSFLYNKQDDLLLIKYFDRLHNMCSIQVKSPIKIKKIIQETSQIFLKLSDYLNIRPTEFNLLTNLCDSAKYC